MACLGFARVLGGMVGELVEEDIESWRSSGKRSSPRETDTCIS